MLGYRGWNDGVNEAPRVVRVSARDGAARLDAFCK